MIILWELHAPAHEPLTGLTICICADCLFTILPRAIICRAYSA